MLDTHFYNLYIILALIVSLTGIIFHRSTMDKRQQVYVVKV